MIGYILILILFALLGIAMIFRPHFFWTVSQWLSVRDGEPTDLYIWFVRISGSIFLVLAVVVIGILLFYDWSGFPLTEREKRDRLSG